MQFRRFRNHGRSNPANTFQKSCLKILSPRPFERFIEIVFVTEGERVTSDHRFSALGVESRFLAARKPPAPRLRVEAVFIFWAPTSERGSRLRLLGHLA